jgi:hypothetical protein
MMLLFFLLTRLPVRVLVPLTEGTGFHASAQAHTLVESAESEGDNDEDQRCCYKIRHAMNSTIIDHMTGNFLGSGFRVQIKLKKVSVLNIHP